MGRLQGLDLQGQHHALICLYARFINRWLRMQGLRKRSQVGVRRGQGWCVPVMHSHPYKHMLHAHTHKFEESAQRGIKIRKPLASACSPTRSPPFISEP